jgi:hypothetical protein
MAMASQGDTLTSRMIRAARLDPLLYREVQADPGAIRQAFQVVILSGAALGIGAGINSLIAGNIAGALGGLLQATVFALVSWGIWALVSYQISGVVLRTSGRTATHGLAGFLRIIGFSASPGILQIFVFLVGSVAWWIANIWMMVAMIIAVREGLGIGTGGAVIITLVGLLISRFTVAFLILLIVPGGGGTPAA